MDIKKLCGQIQERLYENGIHEEIYFDDHDLFEDRLEITIHRGDWKHDHACARRTILEVVQNLPEYRAYHEEVIEEDGSDTYSATHRFYFRKPGPIILELG